MMRSLFRARGRVKVALHHIYVALRMCRVVWHMHRVCMIHIRQPSADGRPRLLVVKWLGLSVTIRLGTGNGYFIP